MDLFVFTAKLNKRKAILALIALAVLLCVIIFLAAGLGQSGTASDAPALTAVMKDNEQRVAYLNSLGWEVTNEPVEEQTITIPREFSDVYEQYNEIQKAQGFDLSQYSGMTATRYTYEVLNYPSCTDPVVADIIVYQDKLIAGNVQSMVKDGFMHGLEFPQNSKINSSVS